MRIVTIILFFVIVIGAGLAAAYVAGPVWGIIAAAGAAVITNTLFQRVRYQKRTEEFTCDR